jgi:hypothetical protein
MSVLDVEKDCRRVNVVEMLILIYENGRSDLLKLFQECGQER